ncbi:MAG: TRAP transporter small permease [Desulfobacteraceae bacterium]|nr:TRAP transporter small permease [Desulfobacteraceae bacterium]
MKKFIKLISAINTIFDAVVRFLPYLAAIMLFCITIFISLDVILRYTINYTFKWVFGGTEYSLLFITFLATAWVLKEDGHVKLDLLLNAFGERVQTWANIFTSLIVAGTCIVFTYAGANYTLYLYQNNITLTKYYTIPQFAVVIIIPIGFFFLTVQSLKTAYYYFLKTK